jgi:hypothetical protein
MITRASILAIPDGIVDQGRHWFMPVDLTQNLDITISIMKK